MEPRTYPRNNDPIYHYLKLTLNRRPMFKRWEILIAALMVTTSLAMAFALIPSPSINALYFGEGVVLACITLVGWLWCREVAARLKTSLVSDEVQVTVASDRWAGEATVRAMLPRLMIIWMSVLISFGIAAYQPLYLARSPRIFYFFLSLQSGYVALSILLLVVVAVAASRARVGTKGSWIVRSVARTNPLIFCGWVISFVIIDCREKGSINWEFALPDGRNLFTLVLSLVLFAVWGVTAYTNPLWGYEWYAKHIGKRKSPE